jgi:hypothetical protein
MSKTYRICSIADIYSIPADRREAFCVDLLLSLSLAELAYGSEDFDKNAAMEWTDDSENNCALVDPETGEQWMSLEVKA